MSLEVESGRTNDDLGSEERSVVQSSSLGTLGKELTAVIGPVSLCMAIVCFLVRTLRAGAGSLGFSDSANSDGTSSDNDGSTSALGKLGFALLTAGIIIGIVALLTFGIVLLFKYNCVGCIWGYMAFSGFVLLAFIGGQVAHALLHHYEIPSDAITFFFLLYNVAACGVVSVFMWPAPLLVKQSFLVAIGALVSYWLTRIPEWTTWALLIGMALYDIVAVLCPGGPLRMLVEMASSSNRSIPALVYETSPMDRSRIPAALGSTMAERHFQSQQEGISESLSSASESRPLILGVEQQHQQQEEVWQGDPDEGSSSALERGDLGRSQFATSAHVAPESKGLQHERVPMEEHESSRSAGPSSAPLSDWTGQEGNESDADEGNQHDSFKLGLGDFVFYSVMVGRAALHDYYTVLAVVFAILVGLQATLIALATGVFKALPALPISIGLGVVFYFISRFVIEYVQYVCMHKADQGLYRG